jgi:hypothetical protein
MVSSDEKNRYVFDGETKNPEPTNNPKFFIHVTAI